MANTETIKNVLKSICDAIRAKTGKTAAIPFADIPQEIANIDGGGNYFKFGGKNARLISEYDETFTLEDTSFIKGSSTSTSATSIKAAVSNRYTTPMSPTVAYGDKDIVVVQRLVAIPTHSDEASGKAQQIQYAQTYISWISKRKTNAASGKTTRQVYNTSAYINKYYSTGGAVTRAVANYGFYGTPSAPTVASATAASTYVRVSSPVLYYRVSSSYESADNIKLVDDVIWQWHVEVYEVDAFSTLTAVLNDELDELLALTEANATAFLLDDEIIEDEEERTNEL